MKSIRAKIMWLIFYSVLISSLIIGITGVALTSNVISKSSTENMRLLCKNNADQIDITFAKIEESVNTLVHYVESELSNINNLKDDSFRKNFSDDIQKNALHHIENVVGAAAIYLHYDPDYIGKTDGFYYAKNSETDQFKYHPLKDISDYPTNDEEHVGWWYIPTISGEATWFEAYYEATLGRYVVSYVVPIYKNEQLIGVIGADIFTEHIENRVKEVSVFSSGKAAVLKSDGTVLYHPNFERGVLIGEGDPGFDGVIEKLTAEDSTKELISYKLKGEKRKLASCKLRNGMLMVCFAPESEIYQQQNWLIITNSLIMVIVVLMALFIAFLVSVKLARPIKHLNEAAKHLTVGEFDFEISVETNDEIGELAETFIETQKTLKSQIHLLNKKAHHDGLTSVGNKSAFMDREIEINKEISEGNANFSVVVFDVNKLKVANDVFGHMAGDKLLATIADYLAQTFEVSNVYRIGGDEFVVIIPKDENTNSAEKVIACIEGMQSLTVEDFPDCAVTCAYGFSSFERFKDQRFSDVLRRADKEMYKNKAETKKQTYPWQAGAKGIKQLQIDKYCELLKTLKDSTDDYLYIMNLETGIIRFFGEDDLSFHITEASEISADIKDLLEFIFPNDHTLVKNTIQSIINCDTEIIDVNFRMYNGQEVRWANCRGNIIKDEKDNHFLLIGRISLNAVKHLYNPITTLFNKTKFKADLANGLINEFESLMLIDIGNLSEIYLQHGLLYGDNLLKELAEILENKFSMQHIYHSERDRFVILLNGDSVGQAENIFSDLKEILSNKCSISASVVPNDDSLYVNAENIYNYAVQILNNSKKNGIGHIAFFSKEDLLEKSSAAELLEKLEKSVKNNCEGFHLVYQPQMNAEDYSIVSAEALLRFSSKETGQIYPDRFIPVLEQSGLINEVGIWVVKEAIKKCKKWREYNPDFKISVNVSPKQLESSKTALQIIELLSEYDLSSDALILEITESIPLDETEDAFTSIIKLRQSGVQIAIDDFGTGYSNLGNLKHIHANILKIDRVFIKDIKENGYNYNLIYNILNFAKSNSLKVCLEGVETKDELMVLSSLHPDIFQGYLFDRPCDPELLEAKYFNKDSAEYINRIETIEQLYKEKSHAPIANIEMKTILSGLNIGLWIMRIDLSTGEGELYTDEIMRNLLGIKDTINPKECYLHWYNNIKKEYVAVVEETLKKVNTIVQVEYLWNHPQYGDILVRSSGRCVDKNNEYTIIEGFHRRVDSGV